MEVVAQIAVFLVAAEFWSRAKCNEKADADTYLGWDQTKNPALVAITKAINGGLIGLGDRAAWLARTKAVWV